MAQVREPERLAEVGGAAGFVAFLAHLLNGGADAGGIGESQFDLLAVDGDGVALHFGGDLAVGFGGDAGDLREAEVIIAELVELADEGVGALATHAGMLQAEFLPGESESFIDAGLFDFLEGGGLGGGALAGDDGEGLLASDPGGAWLTKSSNSWRSPSGRNW